jgi:hypothetical protein
MFDFGAWKAPVASHASPDGSIEFLVRSASSPFPFVAAHFEGRRMQTIRDAQNESIFAETDRVSWLTDPAIRNLMENAACAEPSPR